MTDFRQFPVRKAPAVTSVPAGLEQRRLLGRDGVFEAISVVFGVLATIMLAAQAV